MFTGRSIALAVITLIVGLALGFGLTRANDRHRHRMHSRVAAGHARKADANQKPAVVQNKNHWDPMAELDQMQQDIDRTIQRATEQLRIGSSFDMPDLGRGTAGYSSALNVRDRGDHFEVRADLPNTDKKDVKVTTEGDREVHVNVTQHQEQNSNANGGQTSYREFGSYDQLVTLPEAADMKDMKVENHDGELVITIPKAKAS